MSLSVSEIRIMVDTRDLASVRAFYRDTLDARELPRPGIEHELAMFELGEGRVVEFFQEDELIRPPAQLSLQVGDVKSLWESLKEKVEIVFPLRHNAWGDSSFCIKDPAGCSLTFFTPDHVL